MLDIFYFGFQELNNLAGKNEVLDNIFRFLADYLVYLIILIAFLYLIHKNKTYYFLSAFIYAIVARLTIVEVIKRVIQSPRPFEVLDVNLLINESSKFSFPSGHTIFLFTFSTIIFIYDKKLGAVLFFLSALVGVSRVIVGVHWPVDILGGAIIGILFGFTFYKLGKRIIK